MSKFLTDLDARLIDEDKIWELLAPLEYDSDILGKIVAKKGFRTDFASIPRWIPFISNILLDTAHREAVIHDELYCKDCVPSATRAQADAVIREAMLARGKGRVAAYTVWAGVRIGGWSAYHKRSVNAPLVVMRETNDT